VTLGDVVEHSTTSPLRVHLEDDRVVKVTGDPESPISRGYLCPKGKASPALLYHPDRLTHPLRRVGARGGNQWQRVPWSEAIDEVVDRFDTIRKESGSEYLAIVTGTGRPYIQMSLRFANALGTPNFVAPGQICYLPRQIASRATLGQLPVADIYGHGGAMPACVVVWGCDIVTNAGSDGMCGGPFLQAVRQARKVIVVDPRRTALARRADHWLQLRPGTDGALALAMIQVIIDEDLVDHAFVDHHTEGFDELARHVREFTPEWAASITRIPAEEIRAAARAYAATKPACIQWGQGVDASACNFQTARSLLILRALTGNVDVPGGDVQWLPPEGVKNVAIFNSPEQRGEIFLTPEKRARMLSAGRFAADLILHPPTFWETVISGQPYRVRGLWILGSNPGIQSPDDGHAGAQDRTGAEGARGVHGGVGLLPHPDHAAGGPGAPGGHLARAGRRRLRAQDLVRAGPAQGRPDRRGAGRPRRADRGGAALGTGGRLSLEQPA
jgi:anaerobic selenocysteine-containing dehydrogenase